MRDWHHFSNPPERAIYGAEFADLLAEHCRFDAEKALRLPELFPEEWAKMLRKRAALRIF
jgi:hypothetical protein